MTLRLYRDKTHEYFFRSIWGLYSFFYSVLRLSELSFMYDLSRAFLIIQCVVSIVLLFMFFIYKRFTLKTFIVYASFSLILFLIELNIKSFELLITVLFMMCLPPKLDFRGFVRFDMYLKIVSTVFIIILWMTGIVNDYIHITPFSVKHSIGFSHPNILAMFIFVIMIEWMYVKFERMRMLDWVAIFGIWLIVWKISSARTSAFTFLVVFCLFYITNKYPKIYSLNWVQAAFKVITPVCAAISFVAVYLYRAKNSIGILINTLMSERINIISSFLDKYDLTLFGQELEIYTTRQAKFMGVRANPLDNAYARCLLMYGIIFFVFLCVAYTIFINRAMKSRMYPLVLMCTFFVFIGIGESYLLNPIFNITLLCLLNIAEFTSEQTEADTILKKKICLRFFKSPRRIWEKRL